MRREPNENAEDLRKCETCGREMSEEEHNYGTEEYNTCIQCDADANGDFERDLPGIE